ncbi:MAG TPA: sigma factor-like helix-turn-helix DNA-binding protein, partial [Gemmata sp.]|nr:sigma factor-like helix-turn-helix DNA-binding protein [Gemmata sp.]
SDLSWREAVTALHEALDELPDRFRLPLVLCYLDGLSRDEAATQLGWRAGSVKAGLERGREKLRAALAHRGVTLSAGLLTVLAGVGSTVAASPELFAATLRVSSGSAPTPILELARPTMTTLTMKAKFLFAPMTAAALCVGLFAAGKNEPPADPPRPASAAKPADTKLAESKPADPKPAVQPKIIAPDRVGAEEPGTFAGRVVGPDGKPVGNATVIWHQKPNTQGSFIADPAEFYATPVTGKTDVDGKFKLDVLIRGRTPFRPFNPWGELTVLADGFGPAAAHTGNPDEKWSQNIELKLSKTEVPIEGSIIDLEGRPVAGVTIQPVIVFFNLAGDLGPWLKSATGSGYPPNRYQVGIAIPASDLRLMQSTTTDKDGLFKLTGLGDERVIGLRVDGPTIESHYIQVMTRAGEKFRITNRLSWHPSVGPTDVYPAKFDHAVAPGGTVRGTVTAADSGKPLVGVRVSATVANTNPPVRIATLTDKDGNYTLTGYPRRGALLEFKPTEDQPYVPFFGNVGQREEGKPITVDVKLPLGVVVTGTVTDKVSGKPLEAVIDYHPHNGNPNLNGKFVVPVQVACNPKDGSYRLVVLPGDGMIAARISSPCRGAYLAGVGAEQVSWFNKSKDNFMSANFGFSRSFYDAYAGITPKLSDDPLKIDLKLDPGVNVAARFVDPDGQPLTGCSVMTSAHRPDVLDIRDLPTDHVRLYALDLKMLAVGIVSHAKRKLVGTFPIDGTKSGELVVKLQPAATVTVRLVDDADGSPLAGAVVVGYVNSDEKTLIYGTFQGEANKDGKVRIEVVPTGIPTSGRVQHFSGKSYKNLPVFESLTLKPGEIRDLGDVKLQLNE